MGVGMRRRLEQPERARTVRRMSRTVGRGRTVVDLGRGSEALREATTNLLTWHRRGPGIRDGAGQEHVSTLVEYNDNVSSGVGKAKEEESPCCGEE